MDTNRRSGHYFPLNVLCSHSGWIGHQATAAFQKGSSLHRLGLDTSLLVIRLRSNLQIHSHHSNNQLRPLSPCRSAVTRLPCACFDCCTKTNELACHLHPTLTSVSMRASTQLALVALALSSSASTSAGAPGPAGVHTYQLARRGRSFADHAGVFDPTALAADRDRVASKYAHSNARYKRNLHQGRLPPKQPRRRSSLNTPAPYDVSQHLSRRQSSSAGSGSVPLTDCQFSPPARRREAC